MANLHQLSWLCFVRLGLHSAMECQKSYDMVWKGLLQLLHNYPGFCHYDNFEGSYSQLKKWFNPVFITFFKMFPILSLDG